MQEGGTNLSPLPKRPGMVICSFVNGLILRDCMGLTMFVLLLLLIFNNSSLKKEVKKVGGSVCTRLCATAWLLAGGGGTAPVVSFSEAVSSVHWGVHVFSLPLFLLFT